MTAWTRVRPTNAQDMLRQESPPQRGRAPSNSYAPGYLSASPRTSSLLTTSASAVSHDQRCRSRMWFVRLAAPSIAAITSTLDSASLFRQRQPHQK